ncbi:MAG: DUF4880 domain-containing protein [Pseudomonadota bacterium]
MPSNDADAAPQLDADEEAASWAAHLLGGGYDEPTQEAFDKWMAASDRNRAAYLRIAKILSEIDGFANDIEVAALRANARLSIKSTKL